MVTGENGNYFGDYFPNLKFFSFSTQLLMVAVLYCKGLKMKKYVVSSVCFRMWPVISSRS